jgi:hypothetical protein
LLGFACRGHERDRKAALRELIDKIRNDNRTILSMNHDEIVMVCAIVSPCW